MIRALLVAAFFLSIFSLPWFVSCALALWYLAEGGNAFLVVLGGFIMDELSGAPLRVLGGFAFVYTGFAAVLAVTTLYLRQTLLE